MTTALDLALEGLPAEGGTVRVGDLELEVAEVDRLSARVSRWRMARAGRSLDEAVRDALAHPTQADDPVEAVEFAPTLNGALLRSVPRRGRISSVEIDPSWTTWRRWRLEGGERVPDDWVVPRRDLGHWPIVAGGEPG